MGLIAIIIVVLVMLIVIFAAINFLMNDKAKEKAAEQEKNKPTSPDQMNEKDKEAYKKKKQENKWADPNEHAKYVCQGGKVECSFCSPAFADIIVTSTTISLQDKPWATVEDKDGKKNFNFIGVCTHPSQQKPGSPPPPCKTVISLGEWKNFSESKIDEKKALVVQSTIPCMISGQDLKITDSGQKAQLTKIEPDQKRMPKITKAYWIDKEGNKIDKIAPNTEASLVIETNDYRMKDEITVKLPVDGQEKVFVTTVNSKGVATLKNILKNENEKLKKKPRIVEAYWQDSKGNKIDSVSINDKASLLIKTEGYDPDSEIEIVLNKQDKSKFKSGQSTLTLKAKVNDKGIAKVKNNEWN